MSLTLLNMNLQIEPMSLYYIHRLTHKPNDEYMTDEYKVIYSSVSII
jgi:hypothetical protein